MILSNPACVKVFRGVPGGARRQDSSKKVSTVDIKRVFPTSLQVPFTSGGHCAAIPPLTFAAGKMVREYFLRPRVTLPLGLLKNRSRLPVEFRENAGSISKGGGFFPSHAMSTVKAMIAGKIFE